jgi:L-alanine-DL-glutamate epimerase-like enolase superfamily enzyme
MRLTVQDLELRLADPFVSNKGRRTTVRQLVVRLHEDGRTGLGTAVPAAEHGTSAETLRAALEVCARLLEGTSLSRYEHVLRRCAAAVPGQWAALAAVDMALHDLLGRAAGRPLYRLWGLPGPAVGPTAVSVGILPDAARLERVRQLAGWPILKLKMSPATDVRCVAGVREVYPGRLWIDGNGSWDAGQAVAAADVFHGHGVELLEQPVPAGTPEVLRWVRERSPVPLVADEDCGRPEDVPKLTGCVDAINIKLLKCGGLRPALEMIHRARGLGLKVMLGCKTESVLGVTAAAQLAGPADYLDLDGSLPLLDDPFAGVLVAPGGLRLPEGRGLGVTEKRAP